MQKPQRSRRHTKLVPSSGQTFVILRVLCGLSLVLASVQSLPAQTESGSALHVQWEPQELVNGSAALFRVTAPAALKQLDATWFDRKLTFRFAAACNCWYGVGGVDLNAKPGKYVLRLTGKTENGDALAFTYDINVVEKRYPSTAVTGVPQKYVQPPPEVTARIAEESALKKQVFSRFEPESVWSGQFSAPVASTVTAIFGSARVFNGTKKTVHEGLDFRAGVGTAVHATNRGTVVLARNLYFEGNCVVLDHGDGLLTLYMHLSEFKVKEGDLVNSGQLLGLSGNTGRVNGPHLHFAARWQGMYLDPETLIALRPPVP
jgi:murein DD-endopeptidase MepM/ murein hydrolase activator NlpD